jgi:hypothetical protein
MRFIAANSFHWTDRINQRPPCSGSSANRDSEGALRCALVGRTYLQRRIPERTQRLLVCKAEFTET